MLPTGATLNGTVNPAGVQLTDCHFVYGTSTGYGQSVPCTQTLAAIGAGNSPVPVGANLTGLTAGTVHHFRLVVGNENGRNEGQDEVFGPPRVDGQSSSGETNTTATLQAQIDPDGVDTTYHFEYGTTRAYGTSIPVPATDVGTGSGDQPVSVELTGLHAGVTYHYRVVAVNSAGTSVGEDETFTTVPPARIEGVAISDVTSGGARVQAQIDPLGADTAYHIEYGPSTAYGSSIPAPAADIGAGEGNVDVSQQLTGLAANTTYHVRVVAVNAFGTELSGDHTFVYSPPGAGLPDNRAYEMVTPPQKNGALVGSVFNGLPTDISEDGKRAIATSIQCLPGAGACAGKRGTLGDPYLFTRTPGGWVTTALAPPATQFPANASLLASANAGTALFSVETPPAGEDDWLVRGSDGSFVDVGPVTPSADGPEGVNVGPHIATADLSYLAWESREGRWPFDSTFTNLSTVYEYAGAGHGAPVLVGVSGGLGSTDLISECGTSISSGAGSGWRHSVFHCDEL